MVCKGTAGNGSNCYGWSSDMNNPYKKGEAFITSNKGSSWFKIDSSDYPDVDFCFQTYGYNYNNPPNTPTITGEISGAKKTSYDYTIQTTDPEENKVEYYIDWDDGTHNITDFYKSGEEISISHKWDKKGNYSVKVQAIDILGAESNWTMLTVTMPYSYNKPITQFLELLFERFPNAFPLLRQLMGY